MQKKGLKNQKRSSVSFLAKPKPRNVTGTSEMLPSMDK